MADTCVQFVPNSLGGQSLVFNEYKSCVVAECSARITTQGEILHAIEIMGHSHDSLPFEFDVVAFRARLMERGSTETTPIATIYGEEIAILRQHHDTVSDDLLKQIPALKALTTILYHQIHKILPRRPASRPQIHLEEKYSHTEDAFKAAVSKFGHVDVMCNNAGILDERIWEKELVINFQNSEMKAAEVRLVSICPTCVKTAILDLDDDQVLQPAHLKQVVEQIEFCKVDQVAEAFLMAMEDDTINGTALTVRAKEGVEKLKLSMVRLE